MKTLSYFALSAVALAAAGCATAPSHDELRAQAIAMMKSSFNEKGQAKLDRIDQDDMQRLCSQYSGGPVMPKEMTEQLEKAQQALIKYPADGKMLGDWKSGERIAQSGVGKQYSDDPKNPAGGNCYACHQLSKAELSFGTMGPSLNEYGKIRKFREEEAKAAYAKIFNAQSVMPCSNMPRFGLTKALTEQQIKDVVAYLFDPESPVNK
jgi:L-cysteine S-thiosulfotransferase